MNEEICPMCEQRPAVLFHPGINDNICRVCAEDVNLWMSSAKHLESILETVLMPHVTEWVRFWHGIGRQPNELATTLEVALGKFAAEEAFVNRVLQARM